LALCRRALAPRGIALVSYNALPGWHLRGVARDLMRHQAARFAGTGREGEQARAALALLADRVAADGAFARHRPAARAPTAALPDWYLLHDHLAEHNEALWFHAFAARARRHDLQYLGEAEFFQMVPDRFGEEVAATLKGLGDLLLTEHYMDLLCNRSFRLTLL